MISLPQTVVHCRARHASEECETARSATCFVGTACPKTGRSGEESLKSLPDQPSDGRRPVGRRRAIAGLAALVVVSIGGVPMARRWLARHRVERRGREESSALPSALPSADDADSLTEILPRVATLTGALFGHRLDERDARDLSVNLAFLARHDGSARAQFPQVADYVDRLAVSLGAASFATASDDIRDRIVAKLMACGGSDRRSRLLAHVSEDERIRRRMREHLLPRLAKVYRASPPLWRRRGYARTPGEGGDPREYTKAGTPPAC